MGKLADVSNDPVALETIAVLEKVLSEKVGESVALVAYSGNSYADLKDDKAILDKIAKLEKDISSKTGNEVILLAFSGQKA